MAKKIIQVDDAVFESENEGAWFQSSGPPIWQIANDARKEGKDARAAVKAWSARVRQAQDALSNR